MSSDFITSSRRLLNSRLLSQRLKTLTLLTADIANATTYEDIAGQWCGDVTDYVFAPNTLTVKFHDNRPANVFNITKYNYANDSVRINWINGVDKESDTVFAEFSGSKMVQQGNGDKPRRSFHRC